MTIMIKRSEHALLHITALIGLASIGRLLPHPPNVTPIMPLAAYVRRKHSYALSLGFSLLAFVISDALLAWLDHTPCFGHWSLFTYSGLIFSTALMNQTKSTRLSVCSQYTLVYWLWTNLGVYLYEGHDKLTLWNVLLCYERALPFLGYAVLGNVFYTEMIAFMTGRKQARSLPVRLKSLGKQA